jgi:colicin import membrane protein
MKKLFFTMLALLPLALWAQDNTWELNEEEEIKQEKKVSPKVDVKYLKGAVPEVNGQVVFSSSIEAPGKTAGQVYDILLQYMERLTKTTNQIESKIVTADVSKHEIIGTYQEWLVFKKTALTYDQTRFFYVLNVQCSDGRADVKMMRIRYLYEEERNPQRLTAEEWITDKEAVNKKNTKLYPISGKFRRKTIDRKDFLFNKFATLLK